MRRTLTAVATLVAALLLVPSMAVAQAPTGDYASGFGFWNANNNSDGDDLGPGSIGFESVQNFGRDDEFDYRRRSDGQGFHAQITCLFVNSAETEVFMRLQVERSTGSFASQYVAYGTNGGNGQGDTFDLDPPTNIGTDPCGTDRDEFEPDSLRGNIYLADDGAFGGPF